ncbi:hypothetical protein M3Y94_00024600 [Aphelenchoides besseyi]|nr:hypothetical protein M3Y94_00024600 [Aphelenchoides besseyi]
MSWIGGLVSLLLCSYIYSASLGYRCRTGETSLDDQAHNLSVVSEHGCCVEYMTKTALLEFKAANQSQSPEKKVNGTAYCEFNSNSSVFSCCCQENDCNTQALIMWNWQEFREPYDSSPIIEFIPLIVFVVILVIGEAIQYMTLECCTIQPYKGRFQIEMPPEYHTNLRGTKILPYLTKGEAKLVIRQIRTARTTEPSEIKSIAKKPRIISVCSYTTTSTVTNRELGAVILGQPQDPNEDPYLTTLIRMIEIGPREVRFEASHLLDIIDKAEEVFKSEPTLIEVPVPVQIYGDIHGQYSDLLRFFHLNGWPPTTRVCFLGDYVDRGRHGIEVIVLLFLLKIVMPHDVYLCRGNHEDQNINRVYSFYAELQARLAGNERPYDRVFQRFMQCFTYLPLAARIGKRVLGMHGGLSPKLESLDDIVAIQRPANLLPGTLASDLAWSDPSRVSEEYEINFKRDRKKGIGYLFGQRQVKDACKNLGIDLIVRGHQAPMMGYELFGDNLITIFTAPGYRTGSDLETNYGASIHLDENGEMIVTRIGVDNQVRLWRELQKLDKGEPYTNMDTLVLKPKREDDDGCD